MSKPTSPEADDNTEKETTPTEAASPEPATLASSIEPIAKARAHSTGKGYLLGQALRGLVSGASSGVARSFFDDFLNGG